MPSSHQPDNNPDAAEADQQADDGNNRNAEEKATFTVEEVDVDACTCAVPPTTALTSSVSKDDNHHPDDKHKQEPEQQGLPSSIYESAQQQMLLGQQCAVSKISSSKDGTPLQGRQPALVPGAVAVSPSSTGPDNNGLMSKSSSKLSPKEDCVQLDEEEKNILESAGIAIGSPLPGVQVSHEVDKEEADESLKDSIHQSIKESMMRDASQLDPETGNNDSTETDDDKDENNEDDNDKLAEAQVVNEYIPTAVWYNPDAKPAFYKNRRFQLYGFSGLTILFGIVAVAAVIHVALNVPDLDEMNQSDQAPTMAPTSFRDYFIESAVTETLGQDHTTLVTKYHQQALDWIIHQDPLQLDPHADNLIQRFIMAYFYFATSEDGPWASCNPPTDKQNSRCYFKLWKCCRKTPPFDYWSVLWSRWLSDEHECNWAGIKCYSERVTEIQLDAHNLSGALPYAALSHLPFLRTLDLPRNALRGSLPRELSPLKHLTRFEMHYNQMHGSIPVEWLQAHRNLVSLNLGRQQNGLTGSIPSEIGLLTDLLMLFVDSNKLTSTVPMELFGLTKLSTLRVHRNPLKGSLPTEIGNLKRLAFLSFGDIPLTGSLPTQLGLLTNLEYLQLGNTNMKGTIPDEIFALARLWDLHLHHSNFSGTLSTKFGELANLVYIDLSGNRFSGTVPSELGNLKVHRLFVNGNPLTGSIPHEICTSKELLVGKKTELIADCTKNSPGLSPIACACCTSCCSADSGLCTQTGI